jgi:hypothetical protein
MKLLTISFLTYNRQKFLEVNLLRIIKEIKNNGFENKVNIFIGDDKSTDKTLSLIKKYSQKYSFITYYSNQKNLGLPANTFKIIEKSPKSKYLWLLSDDDFLKEGGLKKIVNYLEKYNPDVLYLNYQTVNTYLGKKIKFEKVKSVIGPGYKIYKNNLLKTRKEYFEFIKNLGFYNIRMIFAQQSLPIVKSEILKNNLKIVKNESYDLTKEFYPFDLTLLINIPNKFLFIKEKLVLLTLNNRGWNYDVLKANEMVKKYFNPLQKIILKKYHKKMLVKLKLIIIASIIYTHLVPIVYKIFYFFGLNKILLKAQFGEEKEEIKSS